MRADTRDKTFSAPDLRSVFKRHIRRVLAGRELPKLRMVAVAGPRIDPQSLNAPAGGDMCAFVPNLDRHLAACDVAVVQGGLTTCTELTEFRVGRSRRSTSCGPHACGPYLSSKSSIE
jgi:hypothetical protein